MASPYNSCTPDFAVLSSRVPRRFSALFGGVIAPPRIADPPTELARTLSISRELPLTGSASFDFFSLD
jgi:hypothetical protein